uniref:Uncharacterized protein n=1 Tax=Odontella aurita TaxID=265563 RepID=A0A7S4I4S8_9STRA
MVIETGANETTNGTAAPNATANETDTNETAGDTAGGSASGIGDAGCSDLSATFDMTAQTGQTANDISCSIIMKYPDMIELACESSVTFINDPDLALPLHVKDVCPKLCENCIIVSGINAAGDPWSDDFISSIEDSSRRKARRAASSLPDAPDVRFGHMYGRRGTVPPKRRRNDLGQRETRRFDVLVERVLTQDSGDVSLKGCKFKDNKVEESVVANYGGAMDITESDFQGNNVTGESGDESVVSNYGGQLDIVQSEFEGNNATGSVVSVSSGSLSISNSSFEENLHDANHGVVFVDARSNIAANENNFGSANAATADTNTTEDEDISCDGILIEADGNSCSAGSENCESTCESFKAPNSPILNRDDDSAGDDPIQDREDDSVGENPILDVEDDPILDMEDDSAGDDPIQDRDEDSTGDLNLCRDGTTSGYSDLASLRTAITSANSEGGTYVLCPFTTFGFTDDAISISASGTTLQCGNDGSSANGCIFKGGKRHINILQGASDVLVMGVRMIQSEEVSVVASGIEGASALFKDCHWQDNKGNATVLVKSPDVQYIFDDDPPPTGSTGTGDDDLFGGDDVFGEEDGGDEVDDFFGEEGVGGDDDFFGGFENEDGASRYLQDDSSGPTGMSLTLEQCSFQNNYVDTSLLGCYRAKLDVSQSSFESNEVARSTIEVRGGTLSISDSCFNNGEHSSNWGVVFIDEDSTLYSNENNAGSENRYVLSDGGTFCAGVHDAAGACNILASTPCAVTPFCYSKWMDLANAVQSVGSNGGLFVVCPGSLFDLNIDPAGGLLPPIVIEASDTIIQCGHDGSIENKCVISGGGEHFRIDGSPAVSMIGLSMVGAVSSDTATVTIAGESGGTASFVECEWAGNIGTAAVMVYNQKGMGDSSDSGEYIDLPPPLEKSMSVEFEHCIFNDNKMQYAALANLGGTVKIKNSQFSGNKCKAGAFGSFYGADSTLHTSCFVGNEGELSGSVFVDESSVLDQSSNFGEGNEVSSGPATCASIFWAGACNEEDICEGTCIPYSSSSCQVSEEPEKPPVGQPPVGPPPMEPTPAPTPAPTSDVTTCFTDWGELSSAVDSAAQLGVGSIFVLCPDTLFDLRGTGSDPITIQSSGTEIKCGADGFRKNKCIIFGGMGHFKIIDSPSSVSFVGLTMIASSGTASVQASGEGTQSTAFFIDCEWAGHTGSSVVMVKSANEGGGIVDDETRMIEREIESHRSLYDIDIEPSSRQSMNVVFEYCVFTDNKVAYSAVTNLGGNTAFKSTQFLGTIAEGGAVGVYYNGKISISSSCFVGTEKLGPGSVFVQDGSLLDSNDDNFGVGNNGGECSSVFIAGGCEVEGTCDGICDGYDSGTCAVSDKPHHPHPDDGDDAEDSCLSNWQALSSAVTKANGDSVGKSFIICQNTTLNADSQGEGGPIDITLDDTAIWCGKEGSLDGNCVVQGGWSHFRLYGSPKGVHFSGLTMRDSIGPSIIAGGSADAKVTFTDCLWMGNTGEATVLVYNDLGGAAYSRDTQIKDILMMQVAQAMAVDFQSCVFEANSVSFASVSLLNSISVNIFESLFLGNSGVVGAVSVLFGTSVEINKSCFISNTGYFPGSIFVDHNSDLASNKENYGEDNVITSTEDISVVNGTAGVCENIFLEGNSSCIISQNATCKGDCAGFKADTCATGYMSPAKNETSDEPGDGGTFSVSSAGFKEISYTDSGIFMRTIITVGCLFIIFIIMFIAGKKRLESQDITGYSDNPGEGRFGKAMSSMKEGFRLKMMRIRKKPTSDVEEAYEVDEGM